MRSIGVVTVARSDYGIYKPLLKAMEASEDLDFRLIVGGMHLSSEFGLSVQEIEKDGYAIADKVEMLVSADSPSALAKSMSLGVLGFSQTFAKFKPDLLLILGDRFEMFSAALAAFPFQIPLVHLHGGELTEGAFDDATRHCLTKLSHFHFASTETYRKRICQLGEEEWRVHNTGALSIDNVRSTQLVDRESLASLYGDIFRHDFLLVTFHPVTLEIADVDFHIAQFLAALEILDYPVVFTMANADTCGRRINERIAEFSKKNGKSILVPNLGMVHYLSAMKYAKAMLGNSSSGMVEAASFQLPVINVGTRQDGRLRNRNIIDVGYKTEEILKGFEKSQTEPFQKLMKELTNPYGNGQAASKMIQLLRDIPLNGDLLRKRFADS